MTIDYQQLEHKHFDGVLALGNDVHGDNYLDEESLLKIYENSWQQNINASWVAINEHNGLIGFRLTLAPSKWEVDKWCSESLWPFPKSETCYFKCNTVAESARGKGVGSTLLKKSIATVKLQGAKAGLAHIWLASPGNSAFKYFSANGGKLIKEHPNKWQHHSIEDAYLCPVCGELCECKAAEMLLTF